jgi:PAS domain S-box-containing protein
VDRPDEGRRLEALRRYYLLDTPPEAALDRITRLTARLFKAPISLVTLVDEKRQWFKSAYGLNLSETPREHAFCAHTIQSPEVMQVPDATADERFRENPLVTAHPDIRFYAGAPLRTPDGHHLGTLCILDRKPRPALTPEERGLLSDLAHTVMDELELRLATIAAAASSSREVVSEGRITALSDSLRFSETALRAVLDTLPVAVWIADSRGRLVLSNWVGRELWAGAPEFSLEANGEPRACWLGSGLPVKAGEWGLARALRGETAYREEIEIEASNGARKVILSSAMPIRENAGSVAGAVVVQEEITERKAYERELLRREKQLRILTGASQQINQVLEVDAVLRTLVKCAMELVNAQSGAAGLLVAGKVVFTEYNRAGASVPIHYEFPSGYGVPGWVLQTNQPYISNDAQRDPHVIQEIRATLGFSQLIDVPVRDRSGALVGCFEIHDAEGGRPFDERDTEMLTGLAAAAAVALENARIIEEHEAADEALRQSEERYRRLVEASPDAISVQSGGLIVYANDAAVRLLGAKRAEEVVGRPVLDFIHPDSQKVSLNRMDGLSEGRGKASLITETFRRIDGSPVAVEVVSIGLIYNGQPAVQAVFRDISERVRSEEALRASETQFRAVFDGAVDAMFILDEGWRYTDCNPAASRMTGRPREDIVGRTVGDFSHPEHGQELLTSVQAAAAGPPHTGRIQYVRPDRRRIELEYTVKSNFLPGRHLLVARDVTEQVRLEAQFRQAQKMEAVGRLAGGVAHDFNNLLTVISGYSQIALGQLNEIDPLRGYIQEINRAGDRAATLTRQLLAFSRKQVLTPAIVSLNRVITDMTDMVRRLIGEDIELVTKLAPDLPQVKVDAGQMEQVIMNLAVNARDAMPEGGRLTIETAVAELGDSVGRRRIEVPPGRYLMLAVSDTGCGMDAETLSHIFEPFFTTKGQSKGTGLGLSTVYGIVKQSGGDIWVYSEPARGSVFKIYLPVASAAEAEPAPEQPARVERGSETVLLVEDEAGVRDLIAQILKGAGYRVLAAANGGEALLICERFNGQIHLLLTDIVMPGMSGRDLARRLKELRPDLRVLHMSGYTDGTVSEYSGAEAGAAFIQKPFTPHSLARKVREALDAPREAEAEPGGLPDSGN